MSVFAVTGVAGFIGSTTAQLLLDANHQVIGIDCFLDLLYPNQIKFDRIQKLSQNENFTFHNLDLSEAELEHVFDGTEAVLHFAALAGLAPSFKIPELYAKHNIDATKRIAAAINNTGSHLVHASTSSVYGKLAVGDESLPTNPVSPYGHTKLAAEGLLTNATILRYFSVYGPGQRPEMAYAKAIQAALAGEEFTIFGDGTQSRSNTFVEDAARAAILAATIKPISTMNIAGTQSQTLNQALDEIELQLQKPINRKYIEAKQGDQLATQSTSTRASELLNWQPLTDFKTGIAKQIRFAIG